MTKRFQKQHWFDSNSYICLLLSSCFLIFASFCLVSPEQEEGRVQEETKPRSTVASTMCAFPVVSPVNPQSFWMIKLTFRWCVSFFSLRDVFFETRKLLSFCRVQWLKAHFQPSWYPAPSRSNMLTLIKPPLLANLQVDILNTKRLTCLQPKKSTKYNRDHYITNPGKALSFLGKSLKITSEFEALKMGPI